MSEHDLTGERWATVPKHPNYQVSDRGRVRRVTGYTSGRVLRPIKMRNGYARVGLCRAGVQTNRPIHQLVLEAFGSPKPTEHHEVNHRNSIRDDNRIENLEWVTKSENALHAHRSGNSKPPRGELSGLSKLTADQVREIRHRVAAGELQRSVAASFGVARQTVSKIVLRKRWGHV